MTTAPQTYTTGQRVHVRSRFDPHRVASGRVIGYGTFQTGLEGVFVEYEETGKTCLCNPALIEPAFTPLTRKEVATERRDRKRAAAREAVRQNPEAQALIDIASAAEDYYTPDELEALTEATEDQYDDYHDNPDNCCDTCGRTETGYGPEERHCHRHGR